MVQELYSGTLTGTGLGLCVFIGGFQHVGVNINLVFSLLQLSQYFCCAILHNISIVLKELKFIINPEINGKAVMDCFQLGIDAQESCLFQCHTFTHG